VSARLFEVLKELQQTAQAAERMNRADERRAIVQEIRRIVTRDMAEVMILAQVVDVIEARNE
jgi:hypothetical protein